MASKLRAKTSWGTWFIDVLESSYESARLDRGWSYARHGSVQELKIEANQVTARVLGTYAYSVSITFPELKAKNTVFSLIESNPMFLSQVQAGRLPNELGENLKKNNIDLIPKTWSKIKTSCSCPDWGDPCKHRAAVYYILAEYIDNDPFILFALRGIDLKARYYKSTAREPEHAEDDILANIGYASKKPEPERGKPLIFPRANYIGIKIGRAHV